MKRHDYFINMLVSYYKQSRIRDWSQRHRAILAAVIFQDMKTRYGASYLSYVIAILWPFSHIAFIVAGYLIVNHYAQILEDPVIFVATGCLPYVLCLYPSRLIAQSIIINKPFLNYTPVSSYHLIIARSILEFMNVSIVLLLIVALCYIFKVDLTPLDSATAAAALASSIFLGVAFGFLFAILAAVMGVFFVVVVALLMIFLYIGSLPLIPEYLITSNMKEYLSYNPIFCLTKWFRSAYYPFYQLTEVNKFYVLTMATVVFFISLLGERLLRGRVIGR